MFENREEAGKQMALEIEKRVKERDFIVAAILRGGIVLGRVIADYFKVPLKPLIVKKIGAPSSPELAIGALGSKGTVYWAKDLIENLNVDKRYKDSIVREKSLEFESLYKTLLGREDPLDFANRKVIVVDDGVATGATVICAQMFLKKEKARFIILATPVIAEDTLRSMNKYFDKVVALKVAPNFYAVGQFYKYFPQVENEEVVALMST